MRRTYTNIITSVTEWKQETLSTCSDLSKDVHGTRWIPSALCEPSATMEEVLDFYVYISNALAEELDDTPYVHNPVMFTNRMHIPL